MQTRMDSPVCLVATVGEVRAAQRALGADVLVVAADGAGTPLLGRRVRLLLRTFRRPDGLGPESWERVMLDTRLTASCVTVCGELEALRAVLESIRRDSPWILRGLTPRPLPAST